MASPLEETDRPIGYRIDDPAGPGPDPSGMEAYRTAFRSLSAMQKEALVSTAGPETAWRLASDEGEYLDGADMAPPPLGYMLAGMASAYTSAVRSAAAARDVAVRDLEVVLDTYYTMSGSVLKGTMTAGVEPPELAVDLDADASEEAVSGIVDAAVEASPVTGLLREPLTSRFTLSVNGDPVEPDRVEAVDGAAAPDPVDRFDRHGPAGGTGDDPIVRHTGETTDPLAEADERYTEAGESTLADEHDRIVHLRGICTERDDGTLHVLQKTYSPLASKFEFLAAGPGAPPDRAPDPLAYLSAGIGFCFMTQMGRYASVVGADLPAYRVVQDTRFGRGRPDGGERSAGSAAPVDSHVYLETPEGPSFGREVLDMSEQSCYLHALCRSTVEPSVAVSVN